MLYLKNLVGNLAKDGLAYVAATVRSSIPKIKSTKETITDKIKDIAEDAAPAVEKAHNNMSKIVMDKYSEAMELTKKAEKEKKKNRMKTVRNTIIATTLGFTAGAATGYVLVKKSQIKESDYVFTDDTVYESLPVEQPVAEEVVPIGAGSDPQQKTYKEFNETYQISTDGTTLIKK